MSTATGWTHMDAWLELPRKSNCYQMLKGDSNERFKRRTAVGCNGTSRKLVAKHLKRSKANCSAGSRGKENLKELADQFGASRFIDLDDPRTFDQALKDVTGIVL